MMIKKFAIGFCGFSLFTSIIVGGAESSNFHYQWERANGDVCMQKSVDSAHALCAGDYWVPARSFGLKEI